MLLLYIYNYNFNHNMSNDDDKPQYIQMQSGMNADFFSRATDMSQELFELDMLLAGKMINEEGEWVNDPHREPFLNEEGRSMVKAVLMAGLNKNTFMSDIEAHRVRQLVLETSVDIQIALFGNRHKYGLSDDKMWGYSNLISTIENFLFFAFARPVAGKERDMYTTLHSEQTHRVIESRQGESGGFWSGLLQRGKQKF